MIYLKKCILKTDLIGKTVKIKCMNKFKFGLLK